MVSERNPRLVYARMTGWGQEGPLANAAGHDINYISLTGVLNAIGRKGERPGPPLNMVGDFGGGSMFLIFGILSALVERSTSGKGQVVDAAMVDGTLALSHMMWAFRGRGVWSDERGVNLLDTGAPFYDTYEDLRRQVHGRRIHRTAVLRIAARGPRTRSATLPHQMDTSKWDDMKKLFTEKFLSKTRDEWAKIFLGTDACVSPVLTFAEAPSNEHIAARGSLIELDGVTQHAPAPRFSRTPTTTPAAPAREATDIDTVWT